MPQLNAMEFWNKGMLEYWVWRNEVYFKKDGSVQKLKSEYHLLFIPNIPIIHHSIIPMVI